MTGALDTPPVSASAVAAGPPAQAVAASSTNGYIFKNGIRIGFGAYGAAILAGVYGVRSFELVLVAVILAAMIAAVPIGLGALALVVTLFTWDALRQRRRLQLHGAAHSGVEVPQ